MNNSKGQTQEPVGGMHELKIWPEYFDDVESGKKNFEVRKLDRLFGIGDILHLREWSLIKGYSGRETTKVVTYVMAGGQWGLSEGNCILGIATPPPAPIKIEGEDDFIRDLKDLRNYFGEHDKTMEEHRLYAIADKLLKSISATPPSQPLGIDVDELAHEMADKWVFEINGRQWSNNDSTAGDNFGSYKSGFKAGYAASPNKADRISQLESGIINFLNWLTYKRPDIAGAGAPISILRGLINGVDPALPQSITSEEETDLWEEVTNILYGFEMERRFDMNELLSTYKIYKR